jgi:glycerophosphoryl diester phosphodiesterase
VRKTDRCDLPSYIPTLGDLYEKCGTAFELSLDIEHVEAGPVVMRVAEEAGAASRLWMCYWTIKTLVEWRSLNNNVKLVNSTRLARLKDGPERRAALLADEGVEALNLHYRDWNGGLTTLLHRFDRYAFAWDAQHTRILQDLLRMGIDGVYSDHVDRMMLAINRPEGQPL